MNLHGLSALWASIPEPTRAILAVDPGTTQSAYLLADRRGITFETLANAEFLGLLHNSPAERTVLVVEKIVSYGQSVGQETFETVFWSGRFVQAWAKHSEWHRITRREVKKNICDTADAKDANVRQGLIDRFGGDSVALAGKRCSRCKDGLTKTKTPHPCDKCSATGWAIPRGPLYGIAGDEWAALGVALTYVDRPPAVNESEVPG